MAQARRSSQHRLFLVRSAPRRGTFSRLGAFNRLMGSPRYWLALLLLSPAVVFAQAAPGLPPTDDPREIIRRAAENDHLNNQKARDYTYVEREEDRQLDSKGDVKSTESTTREVMVLYGRQVARKVAHNDQPLTAKEAAKDEQRIQKLVDKWSHETEEQRQKRLAQEAKEREQDRAFVREVAQAYDFRMEAPETLNGRETFVIDAQPRPGYVPQTKEGKYLPKFRFRVWIDKAEYQWVKLDAEVIDTVSWGLFLARLHPGSHVVVEQTRVNDEVWLPLRLQVKVDARLALLKRFDMEIDTTFRNYQKFRSDTRILSAEPAH